MPVKKNTGSRKAIAGRSKKKNHSYLTKRILRSAARSGVRQAASETMKFMGCNVVVEGTWVIKKYMDGKTERIEPVEIVQRSAIYLD
jgi:hypothetical protein